MLFNDETLKEKRVYWFSKSILFDVVALPVHEILTAMSHIKSNSFLQDKKSFDWYKSAIMNGLNKSGTMGCHVVARTYFNKK